MDSLSAEKRKRERELELLRSSEPKLMNELSGLREQMSRMRSEMQVCACVCLCVCFCVYVSMISVSVSGCVWARLALDDGPFMGSCNARKILCHILLCRHCRFWHCHF